MLSVNPVALMSTALTTLATTLHPVGGTVAAIVLLTVVVRIALHPLTRAAVRGERARARLAPRLAELRKRHGSNLGRLVEETQLLYRSERISPYAGALPMLVPAPVVFVLYRVFASSHGDLARAHAFGVPLTAHLFASIGAFASVGAAGGLAVFGAIVVALIVLAWANARRTAMLMRTNGTTPEGALGTVSRVAPYFLLVSVAVLPLAASVYLVTTTAWSLGENTLLRRGLP
ncbi:MAG TPA: membrane protein insertase YidC [Micromonosporaceae bacterium]|jgi:YidC/Oxa1 family membrane protein insertase|nr:membrane protein insertase YidC [Micromonosporaceae bacterium]